jgi:hypothetical protein
MNPEPSKESMEKAREIVESNEFIYAEEFNREDMILMIAVALDHPKPVEKGDEEIAKTIAQRYRGTQLLGELQDAIIEALAAKTRRIEFLERENATIRGGNEEKRNQIKTLEAELNHNCPSCGSHAAFCEDCLNSHPRVKALEAENKRLRKLDTVSDCLKAHSEIVELSKDKRDLESHLESVKFALGKAREALKLIAKTPVVGFLRDDRKIAREALNQIQGEGLR